MSDKYIYRESGGGIARECPPMRGMTFLDAKEVIAVIDEKDAKITALEAKLAAANAKIEKAPHSSHCWAWANEVRLDGSPHECTCWKSED